MRHLIRTLPILLIPFLTGCARSVVSTELLPDGTIRRTVVLKGAAKEPNGVQMGPTLEDIFRVPNGPAWKVTRSREKDELIIRAVRTLPAATPTEGDLALKADPKKPEGVKFANSVVVRQIAPGRWEYRETLRWTGPKPNDIGTLPPEAVADVQKALPAPFSTPENARAVTGDVSKELIRMLFGPGDPMISQMLMHPDLAERRLMSRVGRILVEVLAKRFGDRMSAEERLAATKRLLGAIKEATDVRTKAQSKAKSGPGESDNGALTAMLFSVKLPGRIVSHNGELDEITGEVYWALYPEATAFGDVTLTAVCEK
jgi:hypothetical protein